MPEFSKVKDFFHLKSRKTEAQRICQNVITLFNRYQFKSNLWHSYYVLGSGWGEQEGIHCLVREGLRNLGSITKCFRGCDVFLSISHMWRFNCEWPSSYSLMGLLLFLRNPTMDSL